MTHDPTADPEPLGLDDINRRLALIDELLDGAAHEPSAEQFSLLQERDSLRNLAAVHRVGRDQSRAVDQLGAELKALRLRLENETRARTGFITAKGGGSSSPSPGAWVGLGAAARTAGGLDRIYARISQIETELERRNSQA